MTIKRIGHAEFEEMKGDYPEILYKYRAWNDPNHKKVITKKQLFFTPPSWFEDPNDCRLVVRYDLLTNKEKIKWIEYKLRKEEPNKTRQYYRSKARDLYKLSPLSDQKEISKLQKKNFDEFDVRTGILSLTENPYNEAMWEKYSDNGRGYCVGFNSIVLFELLGGGGKVKYVPTLPRVFPEPIHTREEQIFYQIFYKEDKWAFEDEYRTHTFKYEPLTHENRIIEVPKEAFSKIILGKNMNDANKEDLLNSISDDIKNIEIIEMS